MSELWRRLRVLFRPERFDRDLSEEMQSHLEMQAEENRDNGTDPEEARYAARRQFGNPTLLREESRQIWGWAWIEDLLQDLRYALRTMRRTPGFTTVAVLTLALGAGASTAIFTVVNALLLKPLPYYQPETLVMVWESSPVSTDRNLVNPLNFFEWRARNRVFERLAALTQSPVNLTGGSEPEQVPALSVTPDFFPILGVAPALGRTLRQGEEGPGTPRVAVLSHGLWRRRFGGNAGVLGQTIVVNNESYTVVGVMPAGFVFPNVKAELWLPWTMDRARARRGGRYLLAVARLKSGVTLADARAEMKSLAAQLERERPDYNANWSANVVPLHEQAVGEVRPTLVVLLAAVGFLLLLACANVANLLLIRGAGRSRELAVRTALGAGRGRIVRQLLRESLLLAMLGAALGLAIAHWGVGALLALVPESIPLPRMAEIRVDASVLAFALTLAVASGLLFGVVPAFRASRVDLHEALKQSGRAGLGGGRRLRAVLAAGEIALAVLLLAGAGLMIRSFRLLQSVHPGFQAEHVLTMRLMFSPGRFRAPAERDAFLERVLERVRALPQVRTAGSIHFLPLSGWISGTWMYPAERPAPSPGARSVGDVSVVSPGYFRTMSIPLLRGRDFDRRDRTGAKLVLILNQAAARRFYPGEDPVGKRMVVYWGKPEEPLEIIGVVGDVRHEAVSKEPGPAVYLPNAQGPYIFANLVVRTAGDPLQMARAVRAEIQAVDQDQPVAEIRTMAQVVADSIARPRLQSVLLGLFAGLALALAMAGVYGVVSYSVSGRTQEIGVRMALGARRASVLAMVLRDGALLSLAGVACGLTVALILTRYLGGLLYRVSPTDPLTFLAVSGLLIMVALLACYIPARRAARIDPMEALRYE